MLVPALFVLLLSYVTAQSPGCDFYQNLEEGRTYTINSPNYPYSYPAGTQCRWIANCPAGTNCQMDCNINIYQSPSCRSDRLMVSRTGDAQLAGADTYCSRGTFTARSVDQRLSLGLITSSSSGGGYFTCNIYVVRSNPQPDTCSCGYRKQNRIVGGQETGVNEFPSMAAFVEKSTMEVKCGGVIIDSTHVLTAAHCISGYSPADVLIAVGEHDVTAGDGRNYAVRRFIVHPSFTSSNYDYDIAIVELSSAITFNSNVGPVCLPFKFVNTNMTGRKLTILGWGVQFPGGPLSNVLQKVDVDVISDSECRTVVPNLTSRQICTYTLGKDACQNDSGGPLLYTDPSTGLLFNMGIVSSGRFCASRGQPGVNTRVTAVLQWIQSTTGVNYCRK